MSVQLGDRLEYCADLLGSKKALGDAAGISQAQLFRYIRGESEMPAAKALNVARVAQVDPTWLLSGEGKPEGISIPRRPEFRPELLENLVQLVTEAAIEHDFRLTPQQRGRFTSLLYEALRHEEVSSGEPILLKRGDIVKIMHYLGRESFDELLALHANAYRHLILGEALPSHIEADHWYQQFAAAVKQGHTNWHTSPSGMAYYRRMGSQVTPRAAQRLQGVLAEIRRLLGKGKLKLLDVGCGNGRELAFMHNVDPLLDLRGIDASSLAIKEAGLFVTNGTLPKGTYTEGDFCALPYTSGEFDVVYSRFSLYTLPYLPGQPVGAVAALREMHRVLKPGGVLWVRTVGGKRSSPDVLPFIQHLSADELAAVAREAGFDVLNKETNPAPPEFADNKFEWSVTMWARKP